MFETLNCKSRGRVTFFFFSVFLTGFVTGYLLLRMPQLFGIMKFASLREAVSMAVQLIDKKFGEKSFQYGVRGITVNEVSGEYVFKTELEVGSKRKEALVSVVSKDRAVVVSFTDGN